jgi:hypothetical protein
MQHHSTSAHASPHLYTQFPTGTIEQAQNPFQS